MLNNYAIYEVNSVLLLEKPCYFITKLDIEEFNHYIKKQNIIEWLCFSWVGLIKNHKIMDNGHRFKYWADGTVS